MSNMKVIESIKQNQIYIIFDLLKWNLMLLIFVLIPLLYFSYLYIYLNMYTITGQIPPADQIKFCKFTHNAPTSHMPPPSSHIHTKTHRYIAGSIFCKTICLTFVFHQFMKNKEYYHGN